MILIRVDRRDAGVCSFLADTVEREGETWTAYGRWKYDSGRMSDTPTRYTWPVRRVEEIRWDWEPGS